MKDHFLGFIRTAEICHLVGVSRSTIYRWIQEGKFPPSRKYVAGGNSVGWLKADILEWMDSRPTTHGEGA